MIFSDNKGETKVFGKIKYRKTAKAAQEALFEELTMNSLPLNLLIDRYEMDTKGPGDLYIADKLKERVYFVRDSVAVSIRSKDAGTKAIQWARELDQILVGGNE